MEFLPVNERFNLNKEGKVLTRWQERQRDWDKIQSSINQKLKQPSSRALMMSSTDEYRAKIEEYDLIQAAIPLEDRFVEPWQLTLRGGGPIRVAVGHAFSGLECIYEMNHPKPKMVRKPRPLSLDSSSGRNLGSSSLEDTEAYRQKRARYEKTIREIRPHAIDANAAAHLVVRSADLFRWAKESSAGYFRDQRVPALAAIAEEDSLYDVKSSLDGGDHSSIHDASNAPKIHFMSPKEIVFSTHEGENSCGVSRTVLFKNIGKCAISYVWKKIVQDENSSVVVDSSKKVKTASLSEVLELKGVDDGTLRKRLICSKRESFFCLKDSGVVLPDETIPTQFVFGHRAVYNESLLLLSSQ
jgi:hypothetical protein